jgi:membrane glycosyltransferase
VLGFAIAALLSWFLLRVLSPGGWTVWETLILLCWIGTLPWTALCAANAITGFVLLLARREPSAVAPRPPALSTTIAVCVRNEDMNAVLPPLGALVDALPEHGFVLWILSDTQDPALAAAEEKAVQAFAAARAEGRVRYRRRAENTGFKAGNVMDFLDHHAEGHELMLCLDADSEMTVPAVLRLVSLMEADPKLAILQQLIVGRPARAAFPRLFQFGMRAGMRSWATGQAWWQGDEGPYWGHNAILRIAPFREHARLELLPDGSRILSHDMVESVRLQAAGWKVRCLPVEEGSLESNPPAMPEFLARDERWGAGNMQYWALLKLPGLTPMGRWQLWQAILLFLGCPLWALTLVFAVTNAATGGGAATPPAALAALLAASWAAFYSPKLLGYAQALIQRDLAARYGGRLAFAKGALAELIFMQLFDPVSTLNKALFLAALPFGLGMGWAPQNRAERGIAWRDALRLLWPHTLIGIALTAALAASSWSALGFGLPFTAGLVLAVPLCVVTASPRFSAWLRRRGICATPEELEGAATSAARAVPLPAR